MEIQSNYNLKSDDNVYKNFICNLNKNTNLIIEITKENNCKLTMFDKISGITEICATINNDDLIALIKTLRIISIEIDKKNNNGETSC